MVCGCMAKGTAGEVFKDSKDRACTDIICLISLIITFGGAVAVCIVSIVADPSLMIDLIYPTDTYGNNCGRGSMSDRPVLVYPRLDTDFIDQYSIVVTGRWWSFDPTGFCAEECPDGFDLSDPVLYGGPGYPCGSDNCTAAEYYYTFRTTNLLGRCIPSSATLPAAQRNLCVFPNCTSAEATALNASYPGSISCATVDSQPNARNTWVVCPAGCVGDCCTAHQATCDPAVVDGALQVTEAVTETFTPTAQTDEDIGFTQSYATYVQLVLGGSEGLIVTEGIISMTIFGVVLPIVAGFVWAIFLWFFAGIVVYVLIGALVTMLVVLDVVLLAKAGFFSVDTSAIDSIIGATNTSTFGSITSEASDTWQTWFTVLAVISIILTVMLIIFLVSNRKCIARLVGILQEVTKVFKAMFGIVLWPFFDILGQTLVFLFGFFALFFTVNAPTSLYNEQWHVAIAVIFLIFVIFWLQQFVRATVWSSMSATICRWYIEQNDPVMKECCGMGHGIGKLVSGTSLILCKHLGTMAFGALIIAVVQTIRAMIQMVDYYTQDLQKKNYLLSLALKCIQCCLACIQRTIEMITYYGFVFTAMQGEPFCKACYSTFAFVMANPAQTAINKTVSKVLNLLIGISTPTLSAAVTFWYLEYGAGDYPEKYNTLVAAAVTFLISYIVTSGITSIYDCAIDTIFLCSFKDMNDNKPPKYMSNDLRAAFGLDLADEEAYLVAGVPVNKAINYKSHTQRRRERKSAAGGTTTVDPAGVASASASADGV